MNRPDRDREGVRVWLYDLAYSECVAATPRQRQAARDLLRALYLEDDRERDQWWDDRHSLIQDDEDAPPKRKRRTAHPASKE